MDPLEKQTAINYVRVGSNPQLAIIKVQQSAHQQCVITWDMIKGVEKNAFDTSNYGKIFFDSLGECYITEKDYVILCEQNVKLKSYDVSKINKQKDKLDIESRFGIYKGHRVDYVNHNWMLFNEYLSLSFSFMTLVIRDRFQKEDTYEDENYIFDEEQYNFIINRRTCFSCDKFVG